MYKISPGVTGIGAIGKEIIAIDIREFKIFCYSLQGLKLLKVIKFSEYDYPYNCYRAKVQYREDIFFIYMNYYVPILRFSETSNVYKLGNSFVDKPSLQKGIESLNNKYLVVPANELNSKTTKDNFELLEKYEYEQVIYWYPHTVGEVLFTRLFD